MELEDLSALDTIASLGDLQLVVLAPTAEEVEAHAQQLEMIERESKGKCLWKQLEMDAMEGLLIEVTAPG